MSSIRRLVLVSLVSLLSSLSAPAAGLRILSLEPTVLFPNREPLAQVARLTVVNDSGAPVRGDVVVTVAGGGTETVPNLEFAPNQSTLEVLVPDLAAPAAVKVELRSGGAVVANREQPWQPQRKWKIHIVKSSHEDLGYENYIFDKQHEIAQFIDFGREASSPRSVINARRKDPKADNYHYTLETLIFQRNYLEERGERAWRELVENEIKPGNLALMGAPSGMHTHWMDYEELARMTYSARRETRDRFGLDLKTFMIVDNPSLSWSGMQALADAGYKYVARWGQVWRSGGNNTYATTKVPAIFWWQGPDAHSRVLFTWRSSYSNGFWMGQTGVNKHRLELGAADVSAFLQRIESGAELGPYPYDAVITPEYSDHALPYFSLNLLPSWRERWAYPQIMVSSPTPFLEYIEKKYGATLPVLSGDLNNFSADYATIDPESQDWKRRAARLLPAAESLGVIAGARDAAFALLPAEVERDYVRLSDYDEHCWPTQPPVTDAQLFNANWVKKHEARRALEHATALFHESAAALGAQIASPGPRTIAIFNPLAHARSDLVELTERVAAVTDLRSGKTVACEPTDAGGSRFLAEGIPALGYVLFRLEPDAPPAAAPAPELQAGDHAIANAFYEVRFDPVSGAIASLVDKATGRDLIDPAAPYRANQLVYVHKNERDGKEGFDYVVAKAVRMAPRLGRTEVAFDVWIEDPKLGGKIRQTVTLHAGVKRVDLTNRLEKIAVMWSADHKARYGDNLFYAFPFAVANGQFRAEYPGGVVRPYDDQLRWGSHDYLYANRWVDVSNAQGGVTLASREAGTFSFGEIRYNQLSVDYKPAKSWLFSYAWSNRMAGLITLGPDDCNATLNYSITSHDGDWNSGTTTAHGWRTASPLLVLPVTGDSGAPWKGSERSFLTVSAPNVQLTVLKASGVAGKGWIARFVETEGRPTDFELDASALGVRAAADCNLVEDDAGAIAVHDGKLRVSIRPFGFATVRLIASDAPAAVTHLKAADVTDSTLRLAWSGPAEAAYNVFRSDDPAAPPTAYSLVARTPGPTFADRGLNLATKYYYRVAAVNAANLQGPVSEPLVVETAAKNQSAPAPVHELGVVRRAADTLIVYWRKNSESDVARYQIYRGETPDFSVAGREPVGVVDASSRFLQLFRDTGLKAGQTYYYRVQPVDWAANVQNDSPVVGATTPAH